PPHAHCSTLSLHDALPISTCRLSKSILVKIPRLPTILVIGSQFISTRFFGLPVLSVRVSVEVLISVLPPLLEKPRTIASGQLGRSEEHTSELQSRENLVCR